MSSNTPSSDFPGSSIAYVGDEEATARPARDRLAEDVSSLRADMTKIHDIVLKFASEAGGQATWTARNVGQVWCAGTKPSMLQFM